MAKIILKVLDANEEVEGTITTSNHSRMLRVRYKLTQA